ncbi:MAG: hypothetical protein ACK4UN_21720 [Limisphaerales bacterium]
MPNEEQASIVANGGWVEQKLRFKKKALIFKFLALFWIVPSLGSIFVLLYNFPQAAGLLEIVKQIRVEQWLACLVLLVHPFLVRKAVHYHRNELPEEHTVWTDNPDYDPKNLY